MKNKKYIDKILKDYSFINIPVEDVIKYIELGKNDLKDNKDKNKTFLLDKLVRSKLDDIVIKRLNDTDSSYEVINSYINNLDFDNKEYDYLLNKIIKFMSKYKYTLDPDVTLKLINNNINLYNILKNTLNSYYIKIVNGECTDYNINILFEIYCMINNIPIVDNDVIEDIDEKKVTTDSLLLYLREISKYNVLSYEEQLNYFTRFKNGDKEAREILIKHNLKLVVNIVKRIRNNSMPMLDLIQEGTLGLFVAIEKFDIEKNVRFSTYAVWWIKQAITRALAEKSRVVRVPVYVHEEVLKFKKIWDALTRKNGKEPSVKEVAKEMNIDDDYAFKLYNMQFDSLSFNNYISDDKKTEFGDFLISCDDSIEEQIIENEKRDKIRQLLNKCSLNERERYIIILRFGFYGNEIKTLEEIAKIFKVTRERIRQMEATALKKIRMSRYAKELLAYVSDINNAENNLNKYRQEYTDDMLMGKTYKKSLKIK